MLVDVKVWSENDVNGYEEFKIWVWVFFFCLGLMLLGLNIVFMKVDFMDFIVGEYFFKVG